MKVISFSAIKGGVGKSSLAVLTANILSASGYKVLCIDADPQNSMSFYYFPENIDNKENFADILNGGKIYSNILHSQFKNIDIIPSSLELITSRSCSPTVLYNTMAYSKLEYDFCIIDTAPTFDNVVLNVLSVSDIVITPIHLSSFDYKSAVFYMQLLKDINMLDNWRLLYNRYKKIKNIILSQYLDIFSNFFGKMILRTKIPESSLIRQYTDTQECISQAKNKKVIYDAVKSFVEEITNIELTMEKF